MTYSRVAGTGSYLPERLVTNADLEKIVETSDEWIVSRTGIRERHYAAPEQNASDLALEACRRAMHAAHVRADEIDLIIVATSTPDMVFPATACILQEKLGIGHSIAFDLQAVCSGFVFALATADKFIRAGSAQCALVVGSEVFSRILDFKDRSTCVLFGDGAGAVVLRASNVPGVLTTHLHSDGHYKDMLCTPGTVEGGKVRGTPLLTMEGGTVYKFAVKAFEEVAWEALNANGMQPEEIDWFICHQANQRIILHAARKLKLPDDKVVLTVDRHGNTSAASIPLALDVAVREHKIKPGDNVLMAALGGGFTWGAALIQW
ncbi:MAG TPA: beta-ketoacyl-ACP synthase III [Usitatibacteraceae bacterium]|nr:beta-ketoacyl-ACP synthase III [Usitatibacteraceae bacterium]